MMMVAGGLVAATPAVSPADTPTGAAKTRKAGVGPCQKTRTTAVKPGTTAKTTFDLDEHLRALDRVSGR